VVTHKNCIFAIIKGNQMPLGILRVYEQVIKVKKFHVKIPSGCLENGKQL